MMKITSDEIYEIRELICMEMARNNGNVSDIQSSLLHKLSQPNLSKIQQIINCITPWK